MKRELSRRAALGGGLAALLAPMLAAPRAEASSLSPLRIGVLADLTGPLASHGKSQILGCGYRVEALNSAAAHGHGPLMELLVRDVAAGDPRVVVSELLEAGVHALIGSGQAVLDAAQASCTPLLVIDRAAADMPYVFQAGPSEVQVARSVLTAVQKAKLGKAGLLSLDRLSTSDAFQTAAAARGVTLTGAEKFAPAGDLSTPIKTLVAQNPELLLINSLPPFDGEAVREARAAGWTGPILLTPESANPAFHGTAGSAAEGVRVLAPWLAAPAEAPEAIPHWSTLQRFTSGYAEANGPASANAGYAADAISMLHLAYLGHRDRKAAREQLDGMCCIGVTGVYNMSPANHAGLDGDALVAMTSQGGMWTADKG